AAGIQSGKPCKWKQAARFDGCVQDGAVLIMQIYDAKPHRLLRGFLRDRRGVSALEFAIILPLMIALYLGCVEVGNALSGQFKTTLAARPVADLSSQYKTINDATMTSILGASSAVLAPFSSANAVVIVSEVTTDARGNATITWSDALNGTARQAGSSVTLPA